MVWMVLTSRFLSDSALLRKCHYLHSVLLRLKGNRYQCPKMCAARCSSSDSDTFWRLLLHSPAAPAGRIHQTPGSPVCLSRMLTKGETSRRGLTTSPTSAGNCPLQYPAEEDCPPERIHINACLGCYLLGQYPIADSKKGGLKILDTNIDSPLEELTRPDAGIHLCCIAASIVKGCDSWTSSIPLTSAALAPSSIILWMPEEIMHSEMRQT